MRQPQGLHCLPEGLRGLPRYTGKVISHLRKFGFAGCIRLVVCHCFQDCAIFLRQVAGQGGGGEHGSQLSAFFTLLLSGGKRVIALLQVCVDAFPALGDDAIIAGHKMAAGGAGVAVAVIVEPQHGGARSVLTLHQTVVFLRLRFGEAVRGHDIESRPGQQVAGQDLLGHVVHHGFLDEPGAPLWQAPIPEVRMEAYRLSNLFE